MKAWIVHSVLLIAAIGAFFSAKEHYPELWGSTLVQFGTLSGFVTLYGVLFTIVEVFRSRAAAEEAAAQTARVVGQLQRVAETKNLGECYSAIEGAVRCIDNQETVPFSLLNRIIHVYSHHYHDKMEIEGSRHALNCDTLESFTLLPGKTVNAKSAAKLRGTLMNMTKEVAVDLGRHTKMVSDK